MILGNFWKNEEVHGYAQFTIKEIKCNRSFVMAEETGHEAEWLDFSSSNFENHEELFEPINEDQQTVDPKEETELGNNGCSQLESIRKVLQQSLTELTHARQFPSSPRSSPDSSAINESCKHWYVIDCF